MKKLMKMKRILLEGGDVVPSKDLYIELENGFVVQFGGKRRNIPSYLLEEMKKSPHIKKIYPKGNILVPTSGRLPESTLTRIQLELEKAGMRPDQFRPIRTNYRMIVGKAEYVRDVKERWWIITNHRTLNDEILDQLFEAKVGCYGSLTFRVLEERGEIKFKNKENTINNYDVVYYKK